MPKFIALYEPTLDPVDWERKFHAGIGADSSPWGFAHARQFGHEVTFSRGRRRYLPERAVRWFTGCELVQAFVHRKQLAAADGIFTHTEREGLAAAIVLRLMGARRPVLQGNFLWLLYKFNQKPWWQRWLARWAMERIDIPTCNAMPNIAAGEAVGIGNVRYVPYGISTDSFPITAPTERSGNLISSIGRDEARDWQAIVALAEAMPDMHFRVAIGDAVVTLADIPNVEVRRTNGVTETNALYDQSRMVVLPLLPNFHASGITVMLEAVARGVPVVAGLQGGLDDYFSADEVWYYGEDCKHKTLVEAAQACLADPAEARARAERAQQAFRDRGYDSVSFIERLLAVFDQEFAKRR